MNKLPGGCGTMVQRGLNDKERTRHMDEIDTPDPQHAKILDYWMRRRQGLSEQEWHDFYRAAVPLLLRFDVPSPFRPPHRRRELVDTFFTEKIVMNAATTKAGPLKSPFVLGTYLRRYALDLLEAEGEAPDEGLASTGQPGDPEPVAPTEPAAFGTVLTQAQVNEDLARQSADRFLETLEDGEFAYLRRNACVHKEDEEPISQIADRLSIRAQHYKAQRLGVTRVKGETHKGYENTKIGSWLLEAFHAGRTKRDMHAFALHPDWAEEIAALLVLLCQQVHKQYKRAA